MSEIVNKWGQFFKENPEKVLGEVKVVKGRFGMVTITKGDPTKIKDIDAPEYRVVLASNPTQSEEVMDVTPENISEEQVVKVKKSIKKSKKNLAEISIDKGNDEAILWSFEETDEQYNVGITDDDKRAYVYYIEELTGKAIVGGFSKYSSEHTIAYRTELMEKGVLFYDMNATIGRKYQPKFLFASGNIYDKKLSLTSNKESFLGFVDFNELIYENHLKAIEDAYKDIWDRRLTLDNPNESLRLKILPISGLAKTFKIVEFVKPDKKGKSTDWRVYVSHKGGDQTFDMTKSATRYDNKARISEVNLKDGFILWLKEAGDPAMARNRGIIYRNGMDFNQIYNIYIKGRTRSPKGIDKNTWLRIVTYSKLNGDRLFAQFLAEGLTTEDRRKLELLWNRTYNATINYDVNKVPIGFEFAKYFGVDLNDIRPEKREAIGFSMVRGSSCLAYGVGIGKTWCGIFNLAQNLEMGLAKRPLVVVPNQVYPQFLKEIKTILPQYDVNGLYNLRGYYEDLAYQIKDGSISICTYEGLESLGFSDNMDSKFTDRISSMLESTDDNLSERQKAKQQEKYETMLGKGKEGSVVEIDDENVNFDYLVCDEAHNFKKLFTNIKGKTISSKGSDDEADRVKRERTPYSISSGISSSRAVKLFFLTQYIQDTNKNGNCLLLTATPFTNSPLEVYSILAMINYNYLEQLGFKEMRTFFDTFADISTDLVINTLLKPVRKQVFKGWNNVIGLQDLVFNFIDKKGREDEDKLVTRPNKLILPLKNKMVDGIVIPISKSNQISTTLKLSDLQSELMTRLQDYAEGEMDFIDEDGEGLCNNEWLNTTSFGKMIVQPKKSEEADGEGEVDLAQLNKSEDEIDKFESAGVRALQCLAYSRQLALSPYLFSCSGLKEEPTAAMFVESSPKLLYVVECIKSVQKHHKEAKTPMSGQVIYMDIGTKAFPLIVKYLIEELGFKSHEVGYITGSGSKIGTKKSSKDKVQDAFLGRVFDEKKQDFEPITDAKRLKVLIGSSSIREGMNLQSHATVLYNCYLDFNPTDNIQLEGRIWRQGNKFANVRIVMPMMENSMDIFMFQKLEEKTERINQLWVRDGMTNEIDTSSFDPSELKYELITNPTTLAQLQVEDEEKRLDEQIDDINYEFGALNNFAAIYSQVDGFYKEGDDNLYDMDERWRIGGMYHFLRAFRPDLVPLNLIKDHIYRDWGSFEYDKDLDDSYFNYSLEALIDKMVEFNRDRKISYPENYTLDWRDGGSKSTEPEYEVGDVITFDSRRGRKQGTLIEQPSYNTWDIDLGNDNIVEDVNLSTLTNLEKVVDESDVVEEEEAEILDFFNWGTKESKERISDINEFQVRNKQNWNDARHRAIDSKPMPSDYGYQRSINDYLNFSKYGDDLISVWLKDAKWVDLTDRLKSQSETSYGNGYKTSNGGRLFWDAEYSLLMKKVKKGEEEFLIPKGIKNKTELLDKISGLKGSIEAIEEEKKSLTGAEQIALMSQKIEEEMVQRKLDGTRKPSTYKERAKEFSESNADYKGNDYLAILQPKKNKKKKDVVIEAVVEKSESHKAELKRISKLESTIDFLDGESLENLQKRINRLKLTLDFL